VTGSESAPTIDLRGHPSAPGADPNRRLSSTPEHPLPTSQLGSALSAVPTPALITDLGDPHANGLTAFELVPLFVVVLVVVAFAAAIVIAAVRRERDE
jgi:hypothetical protein